MIKGFSETIRKFHMINKGDVIAVGLSGGADSLCLFLNLCELKRSLPFTIIPVHVNHMYREDASEDESFVASLCRERGMDCIVVRRDMQELAGRLHLSLEEAGRQIRYEALRAVGADRIAVGHHSNDLAETMIMNMCRGTGIKGMAGIEPVSGDIIRPLLYVSRKEIEEYMRDIGQEYKTDYTNASLDYTRNRVRLQLMPMLEEQVNSEALTHMAHLGEDMRRMKEYLEEKAREALELMELPGRGNPKENRIVLDISVMNSYPSIIRSEAIFLAISRLAPLKDIGRSHVEGLLDLTDSSGYKELSLPYGIKGIKEYGTLTLEKRATGNEGRKLTQWELPLPIEDMKEGISYRWCPEEGIEVTCILSGRAETSQIPRDKYTKWLDCDRIGKYPVLRYRKAGDFMEIDRQGHHKSIKSIMIDYRLPRLLRDRTLLLADGSTVSMIEGMRIGESCKVTADTEKVLQITIHREEESNG